MACISSNHFNVMGTCWAMLLLPATSTSVRLWATTVLKEKKNPFVCKLSL